MFDIVLSVEAWEREISIVTLVFAIIVSLGNAGLRPREMLSVRRSEEGHLSRAMHGLNPSQK